MLTATFKSEYQFPPAPGSVKVALTSDAHEELLGGHGSAVDVGQNVARILMGVTGDFTHAIDLAIGLGQTDSVLSSSPEVRHAFFRQVAPTLERLVAEQAEPQGVVV